MNSAMESGENLELDDLLSLVDADSEDDYKDSTNCKNGSQILQSEVTSETKTNPPSKHHVVNSKDIEEELRLMKEHVKRLEEELLKTKENKTELVSTNILIQNKTGPKCRILTDLQEDIFSPFKDPQKSFKKEQSYYDSGQILTSLHEDISSFKDSENSLKNEKSFIHSGDTDSSDDECLRNILDGINLTEEGKQIRKRLAHKPNHDSLPPRKPTWADKCHISENGTISPQNSPISTVKPINSAVKSDHPHETDPYSNMRIINPTVSSSAMKIKMQGRKMVRMHLIHLHIRGGEIEGDWVTIGCIAQKIGPKTSSNGKTYSIWKLTDLQDCDKMLSIFLFGDSHTHHWKTSIGTVVGILNANIFSSKEKTTSEISLSVDHPQKLMILGVAKDYGICKGKKKDGNQCTAVINKHLTEYCQYHIQSAYKKLSSKRMDLQAAYSGTSPKSFKNKILNSNIMYGGQMYIKPNHPQKHVKKDQNTLHSLKLQERARQFELDTKSKIIGLNLNETSNDLRQENTGAQSLKDFLSIPSAGSTNLLKVQSKSKDNGKLIQPLISITAKELLKKHTSDLQTKIAQTKKSPVLDILPQLGRGFRQGDNILLDVSTKMINRNTQNLNFNKLRAIQKVEQLGGITKQDPNSNRNKNRMKIKRNLETLNSSEDDINKRSRLDQIDINSEEFQKLLKRRSKHVGALTEADMEHQERYFTELEKKEKMEQHMIGIKEVTCDVVSCKVCQYTAFSQSDLCRQEGHHVIHHKAKKRFFKCKNCKQRTITLNKIPDKACRHCSSNSFERVGMWAEKLGPKLESEKLLLRGEEIKFLNR